jgi:hypothetical protein
MLSLHVLIPLAVFLGFGIISLALWGLDVFLDSRKQYRGEGLFYTAMFSGLITALALVGLLIALIPFNSKYWFIEAESGKVTSIKTQTVLAYEDATQLTPRFVLTLDDKVEVITEDPRIQNVEVGDNLDLNCTWEFVYGGKDLQNCIIK